jgi:hypothetical protein
MLMFTLIAASLHAQITQVVPVDIGAGITAGTVHASTSPAFTGDLTKPFDGNPFTEMAILNTDTAQVTLQFDTPVRVEKTKVFFWADGKWMIEVADSLADLDTKTGSYAVLVDSNACSYFQWDSVMFAPRDVKCVRLAARSSTTSGVLLGEWVLAGQLTYTKLVILPAPVRAMVGANLKLRVKILDENGDLHPYFLTAGLAWLSADVATAMVDEEGLLTGKALGATTISVSAIGQPISGSAPVSVEADVRPAKVAPMTIKVALVMQDPTLQSGQKIHQMFSWPDPRVLAPDVVRHFKEATDSVVNFQFVETIVPAILFTRYYGQYLTVTQYVQLLQEPGWVSLKKASDSGEIAFDYREFVKYYQYDLKRNNGTIDEVWVFAAPYLGMYESQMLGPNAFWWNSPPIRDGTALTKLLSVMGLNYERGVDQAFHSFGHRMESAVVEAYHDAQGRNWDPKSSNPTPWDLFTRIDKDMPGQAHVGNVHFPPNGTSDYNYGNLRVVTSYAENWYRYPYLYDDTSSVNLYTWLYTGNDPLAEGADHLGYLRWWYGHIPRYEGVTDGVLNNWWLYGTDYETAVALAKVTPEVEVKETPGSIPKSYGLDQNYPNPFNPSTTIRFEVPRQGTVTLKIYDMLGREVATLVNGELTPGTYSQVWDAHSHASGVYFCRLFSSNGPTLTRKLMLLK